MIALLEIIVNGLALNTMDMKRRSKLLTKKTKEDKRTLADHFTTSGVFSIPCRFTRDGFIPLTDNEIKEIDEAKEQSIDK